MILARDERGQIEMEADAQLFPTRQLAPDGILPRDRRYSVLALPLYFREDQIGFVMFETGPREGIVYHTLREQISSASKGILLLQKRQQVEEMLHEAYAEIEKQVDERTAELKQETAERERLQQEVIEAQKQTLRELSAPVIPVMDRIIVMPLIGSIDSMRARDITRSLLAGIREHRAKMVILDVTGVPIVDSGVASHLTKTIQAARLKGAHTIVTGISDAVAETIVDLGIGWDKVETLADLQTGLKVALTQMGLHVQSLKP
jgi:anti-anti-sigma regulatory factor